MECKVPENYVKLIQDIIDPTEVAKPRCAICSSRKQHIQRGCGVAPMICLESIPVPHNP